MRRGALIHHGNRNGHCVSAAGEVTVVTVVVRGFVLPDRRGSGAGCGIRPPGHPNLTVYVGRNIMILGHKNWHNGYNNRLRVSTLSVCLSDHCSHWDHIDNWDTGSRPQCVPPVGVEPTLRTLLGGRPLPLGYGGGTIILRVQLPNRGVTTTASNNFLLPREPFPEGNAQRN
jgi:hypothetical protein